MGIRHESRQLAMQFLYQHDTLTGFDIPSRESLAFFWNMQDYNKKARDFAEQLIQGFLKHQEAVDTRIKSYTKNWEFHRIAVVDRSILRLAIYELLFRDDIPPIVSINEAIELAKKFSTEDSGRFVNGILDRVKLDLNRPLRSPVEDDGS